jgi:hypothetical protein
MLQNLGMAMPDAPTQVMVRWGGMYYPMMMPVDASIGHAFV